MSTLKQLHEQVGKLPMRVRSGGGILTVEYKTSTGDYIATHNKTTHVLFEHDKWQLVPDVAKPLKALAYADKEGLIFHVVVGSEEHNAVEKDSDYQRLECFDIESKS
jgi:hypothetical protein